MEVRELSNCGFRELSGFRSGGLALRPTVILREVLKLRHQASHIIFTDRVGEPASERFVEVVQDNELGTIRASAPATNPNSGNRVKGWIFTPNYEAIATYVARRA